MHLKVLTALNEFGAGNKIWGIGANVQMGILIAHQGKSNPLFELHSKVSCIRCFVLTTL